METWNHTVLADVIPITPLARFHVKCGTLKMLCGSPSWELDGIARFYSQKSYDLIGYKRHNFRIGYQ